MSLTEAGPRVRSGESARTRLLAELAASPARRAYGIAYDLLGNRAEAEEAVQEALALACERIVTTMCLRTLRRRRLRRKLFGWLPGRADADSPGDAKVNPPADTGLGDIAERMHATETSTSAPRDALVDRQALASMLGRLDDLSAQQRTALVLRYGHDLPVGEVAQLLGVELATAKTHLVRGLARLRDLMKDHV